MHIDMSHLVVRVNVVPKWHTTLPARSKVILLRGVCDGSRMGFSLLLYTVFKGRRPSHRSLQDVADIIK